MLRPSALTVAVVLTGRRLVALGVVPLLYTEHMYMDLKTNSRYWYLRGRNTIKCLL